MAGSSIDLDVLEWVFVLQNNMYKSKSSCNSTSGSSVLGLRHVCLCSSEPQLAEGHRAFD